RPATRRGALRGRLALLGTGRGAGLRRLPGRRTRRLRLLALGGLGGGSLLVRHRAAPLRAAAGPAGLAVALGSRGRGAALLGAGLLGLRSGRLPPCRTGLLLGLLRRLLGGGRRRTGPGRVVGAVRGSRLGGV